MTNKIQKIIVKTILPTFIFYSLTILIFNFFGLDTKYIIKDCPRILEADNLFCGFISNLGIIFWIGAALVAIKTLRQNRLKNNHKIPLLYGSIVSFSLAIIDIKDFHNRSELELGIFLFISLATLFLFIILIFNQPNQKYNYIFIISCLFLSISIFIDIISFGMGNPPPSQFFEEAFKFIGIVLWLKFWLEYTKIKSISN